MNQIVKRTLFGGAIFSAGIANAQDFDWKIGPNQYYLGTYVSIEGVAITQFDYDFSRNPVPSHTQAASSGFTATADVTHTMFDVHAFAGTGPPGAVAKAQAFGYFSFSEPTTLHADWDFTNLDTGGGVCDCEVDLRVYNRFTGETVSQAILVLNEATAGSLTRIAQPDLYYEMVLDVHAYADGGSGWATVEAVSNCIADCDVSGTLNIDDIDCFATAFLAGDLAADCDGSGTLNIDDIDCFAASFLDGCD